MGQLAKILNTHDTTSVAAKAVERAAYQIAQSMLSGEMYEVAQRDADRACLRYAEAVGRSCGGNGGTPPTIVPDEEAQTVTVVDEDASGQPRILFTITPETIRNR